MGWNPTGWAGLVAGLLLLTACAQSSVPVSTNAGATTSVATGSSATGSSATTGTSPTRGSQGTGPVPTVARDCPPAAGEAWEQQASNSAVRVLERADGLTVDLVEYPLPGYDGKPWSQWGQGIVGPDGRFFSAVGDHFGPNGNSFFYVFDPTTAALTRFSDVLSHTEHTDGEFGYGKVHAQMVAGPCGDIYAHTYWGTRKGLEYEGHYSGDLLFRIDPLNELIEVMGVPVEGRGTASMAGSPDGRTLYMEAVEPDTNETSLVVYDILARQTVEELSDPRHTGRRTLAVAADGRVFYSTEGRSLAVYDPARGELATTDISIPGAMLRAVTPPGLDGTVIAVTRGPDEFFALDAAGTVTPLSTAAGYTASLALSPDGLHVYSVPGAHGKSWEMGTPLIDLDPRSGDQRTVVELYDLGMQAFGVRLAGTYNVVMDPGGNRIYIGLNAGEGDETFGRVFLAVVGLP